MQVNHIIPPPLPEKSILYPQGGKFRGVLLSYSPISFLFFYFFPETHLFSPFKIAKNCDCSALEHLFIFTCKSFNTDRKSKLIYGIVTFFSFFRDTGADKSLLCSVKDITGFLPYINIFFRMMTVSREKVAKELKLY